MISTRSWPDAVTAFAATRTTAISMFAVAAPVSDPEAAVEGQRGEKRGGATGGAQVPGVQHLERRERAAHRAKSPRQIQDASPGHDPPNTGDQPTAADRRPDAIPVLVNI